MAASGMINYADQSVTDGNFAWRQLPDLKAAMGHNEVSTLDNYVADVSGGTYGELAVGYLVERSTIDQTKYVWKLSSFPLVFENIAAPPKSIYFYDADDAGRIIIAWEMDDNTGVVAGEDIAFNFLNGELFWAVNPGTNYLFKWPAELFLNQACGGVSGQTWWIDNDIKVALLSVGEYTHNPDATLSEMLAFDISEGGVSLSGQAFSTYYLGADAAAFSSGDYTWDAVLLYDNTTGVPLTLDVHAEQVISGGAVDVQTTEASSPYFRLDWGN